VFSLPLRHALCLLNKLTFIADKKQRYSKKFQQIFSYVLNINLHIIMFVFLRYSKIHFSYKVLQACIKIVLCICFFFQLREPGERQEFAARIYRGCLANQIVKPSCGCTRLIEPFKLNRKKKS